MRIKIFAGRWHGDLENQVNKWLEEQNDSISVVNIKLAKEDEMFVIMILYEELEEEQEVLVPNFIMDYVENNKKGNKL